MQEKSHHPETKPSRKKLHWRYYIPLVLAFLGLAFPPVSRAYDLSVNDGERTRHLHAERVENAMQAIEGYNFLEQTPPWVAHSLVELQTQSESPERHSGSGVIISLDQIPNDQTMVTFLTAQHVIDGMSPLDNKTLFLPIIDSKGQSDEQSYSQSVVSVPNLTCEPYTTLAPTEKVAKDLAICATVLPTQLLSDLDLEAAPLDPLLATNNVTSEPLRASGFPALASNPQKMVPFTTDAKLLTAGDTNLTARGDVAPGMSGGPLYNDRGVVGITTRFDPFDFQSMYFDKSTMVASRLPTNVVEVVRAWIRAKIAYFSSGKG